MKTTRNPWIITVEMVGCGLVILATMFTAPSQTVPGLTIAPAATNQIAITITNGISTGSYELWWTPVLDNPVDFPWTMAAAGNPGQTNFSLANWGYPAVFFRGLLDTNAVPLWEEANPDKPGSKVLSITIANPTNGAVLH
jgi:hypothetical protein